MMSKTRLLAAGAMSMLMAACSQSAGTGSNTGANAPAQLSQLEPAAPATSAAAGPKLPKAELKLADLPKIGSCNIEFLNKQPLEGGHLKVDGFSDLVVTGWVIDQDAQTDGSPASLLLVSSADGRAWQIGNLPRSARPDVVKARDGNTAYANAGFQAVIPIDGMGPGKYGLAVVVGAPGAQKACGGNTRFEFAP